MGGDRLKYAAKNFRRVEGSGNRQTGVASGDQRPQGKANQTRTNHAKQFHKGCTTLKCSDKPEKRKKKKAWRPPTTTCRVEDGKGKTGNEVDTTKTSFGTPGLTPERGNKESAEVEFFSRDRLGFSGTRVNGKKNPR